MTTKLTLSIDEHTVKKIKQYSKDEGISISKIAEEHFNRIAAKNNRKKLDITKLRGAFGNEPKDFDWKKVKSAQLAEKYGK
ncbi:MAG: DUF6364 family protein [Ginsengibacter sp.]